MIKKLFCKEFGFNIELCESVNKQRIKPEMICEIVKDKGNLILFYWKSVKLKDK